MNGKNSLIMTKFLRSFKTSIVRVKQRIKKNPRRMKIKMMMPITKWKTLEKLTRQILLISSKITLKKSLILLKIMTFRGRFKNGY
jgi:hypothetical protein